MDMHKKRKSHQPQLVDGSDPTYKSVNSRDFALAATED